MDHFLIPDTSFVASRAYEHVRRHYAEHDVPWERRDPIAFWRGATTGHPTDTSLGWPSLPRIQLCEIAHANGELIDAGISALSQINDRAVRGAIEASGLMRSFVPPTEFNRYKYQIDIDGNTNSWPGLFQKLLTGSPVLKVASPTGQRQWYYDRLKPWVNYVPVASDMSDLVDKVRWLRANDDAARAIGEQGQALALSLDFEGEIRRATRTITGALRYFAGRPETDLTFGAGGNGVTHLREGWFPPEADGVPARDQESRIELEQPIARQDFVLSLDVSPHPYSSGAPQRLGVVANGELLSQANLAERRTLDCRLAHETIAAADRLLLTLLHPDGACPASESRPLDARTLSVVLHGLALSPVGVRAVGSASPSIRLGRAGRTAGPYDLYAPDVWLPPDVALSPVVTWDGTVLFANRGTGQLLHGPLSTSPRNVLLAVSGATAYLLHVADLSERYSINVSPEARTETTRSALSVSTASVQGFRVVLVGHEEKTSFGLMSHRLFLCAEPDGRITLSRERLGPWERFQILQPSPATLDAPSSQGK